MVDVENFMSDNYSVMSTALRNTTPNNEYRSHINEKYIRKLINIRRSCAIHRCSADEELFRYRELIREIENITV